MPVYLTEADAVPNLPMDETMRLLEAAARAQADGDATNMPRQRVRADGSILQVLPASLGSRFGYKSYTVAPRGPRFWYTLYASDGSMLAILEADRLGQIRTGAASGLSTRYLARRDARTLGVIGAGYQARTQIEAICAARPIERVRVFARNRERLDAFCAEASAAFDRPIDAASSAQEAIEGADVVATMTNSSRPVFDGAWLRAGAHVNAAGSNRANAQEIDVETVRRASVIAVDDIAQAKIESGDLRMANESEAFRWLDAARLSDIVAGNVLGRTDDEQITLFESLGIGLWDLAAASHVYDRCVEQGRGTELPFPG